MSSSFNKVVLFGQKGTGKKTIYAKYKGVDPSPTLGKGAGFHNKLVSWNGIPVQICLWYPDHNFYTVGNFPKLYFQDVVAVILLYDVTDSSSFENLK